MEIIRIKHFLTYKMKIFKSSEIGNCHLCKEGQALKGYALKGYAYRPYKKKTFPQREKKLK